jgi:two-component system response regulator AlgR
MKILIVDDEGPARQRLRDLLMEIDAGNDLLEAEHGMAALAQVQQSPPDVVLLDIRMPVMDGLETASHLSQFPQPPAVIFTTAYQDHAIRAFELQAVDYLLKPIRRERLESALQRSRIIRRATATALRLTVSGQTPRTHLSASNYGHIELIPVAEIRYLKAGQKYVSVGWSGRETLLDESLKSLEQEFTGRFLRVHRNTLVASQFIRSLKKSPDGGHYLLLRDLDQEFPVSRRHLHALRQVLLHHGKQGT